MPAPLKTKNKSPLSGKMLFTGRIRKIIKLLGFIFGAVAIFLLVVFGFLKTKYVVPVLMYHAIDPGANIKTSLKVKPQTFEKQMYFLKKNGYQVLPLEAIVGAIREKKKLPSRTVAITFDDGYKDVFIYAFPVLKKYNLPATAFVIVNEIGRFDRLSWEEIKIMQDSGLVTVGSHCLGPEPLIKINSGEKVREEIFASKRALEERLEKKINLFSYPEGMFNAKIRQLVMDAGYLGAVGTNPGRNYPDDDIFVLKRIKISENAKNMFIFAVETSGFYTFMKESKRREHGKK